ncbi:hypothetical protein NKH77_31185 [Streptomyces sp. M19]
MTRGGTEHEWRRGRAHRGSARRRRVPRLPGGGHRPDHPTAARPGASDGKSEEADRKAEEKRKRERSKALPDSSGSGTRVVYSLAAKRVWLVNAAEDVTRTFSVLPSSASPSPGTYKVSSRSLSVVGSDGVHVENVVVFHQEGSVVFGFSAAVDGSKPDPNAEKKTGGIREPRLDGIAMYRFAQIGTPVVVLP